MPEAKLASSAPHILGARDYADLANQLAACSTAATPTIHGAFRHG